MNGKMRSCVMGLIPGQFSSPLPMAQKEPVAYLYNGVGLSDINTVWTDEVRKVYPSAFIYRYSGTFMRSDYLILCQTAPYYDGSKNAVCVDGEYQCYFSTDTKHWRKVDYSAEFEELEAWGTHWTSDSILYKDSTDIYLAASDPIPVYE